MASLLYIGSMVLKFESIPLRVFCAKLVEIQKKMKLCKVKYDNEVDNEDNGQISIKKSSL